MTLAKLFQQSRQNHKSGRYSEAEAGYREILAANPQHADALHSLGLLLHQRGLHTEAVELILQAIAINDRDPSYHSNLGLGLAALGRPDEAATAFERAIDLKPDHAIAYNNLGVIWLEQGRNEDAARCFEQARRFSRDSDAPFNLGRSLLAERKVDAAIAELKRAIELRPDHADAHMQLGVAYRERGELQPSLDAFIRAADIGPTNWLALCNQAVILKDMGRGAEAEQKARRALELNADGGAALNVLGVLQFEQGLLDESIETLRRATRAQPDLAGAHINLGVSLLSRGESAEAVARFEEALRIDPQNIDAHCNRAITWLARGEFETGWLEYEWRWQRKDSQKRQIPRPLWDGSPLDGKWILLHGEQGLGDTLQFIRYAQLVYARGGRVMLACPQGLIPLLKRCPGIERLVAIGNRALPAFDLHAPLLSLPCLFKTTLSNVPAPVPYLTADPALVGHWREKLQGLSGLRVGIHWQGNPKYVADRQRSMSLKEFAPLAGLPGITLVSLQKGLGTEQIAENAADVSVQTIDGPWDESHGAFMDSAAILMNLDLVVTSDTALAHLAGALGVPVWLALPFAADWRWMNERDDSPWYPTMRLFRQVSFGDWQSVFTQIRDELSIVLAGDSSGLQTKRRTNRTLSVSIETSPGDLLDRLSILEIKAERMTDSRKLRNVERERLSLAHTARRSVPDSELLQRFVAELKEVNERLWDIEDRIRECEARGSFGSEFIELARAVYRTNDRRAELKRCINDMLGAAIVEEKSYSQYGLETAQFVASPRAPSRSVPAVRRPDANGVSNEESVVVEPIVDRAGSSDSEVLSLKAAALLRLADHWCRLQQYESARRACELCLRINPQDAAASERVEALSVGNTKIPMADLGAGIVIGHHNQPDFLDLSLRMIRRHCGDVPILVADDASDVGGTGAHSPSTFRAVVELVRSTPHALLWTNSRRLGHAGGDASSLWKGLIWAEALGLRTLFKLSQRFIVDRPDWLSQAVRQLTDDKAALIGAPCEQFGWSIRTEAFGMSVAQWSAPSILSRFVPRSVGRYTEHLVGDILNTHFGGRFCRWSLLSNARNVKSEGVLFRATQTSADYRALARTVGITEWRSFLCDPSEFQPNYVLG